MVFKKYMKRYSHWARHQLVIMERLSVFSVPNQLFVDCHNWFKYNSLFNDPVVQRAQFSYKSEMTWTHNYRVGVRHYRTPDTLTKAGSDIIGLVKRSDRDRRTWGHNVNLFPWKGLFDDNPLKHLSRSIAGWRLSDKHDTANVSCNVPRNNYRDGTSRKFIRSPQMIPITD